MQHFQEKFHKAIDTELKGGIGPFKVFAFAQEVGKQFEVQFCRDDEQDVALEVIAVEWNLFGNKAILDAVWHFHDALAKAEKSTDQQAGSVDIGTRVVGDRVTTSPLERSHTHAAYLAVKVFDTGDHKIAQALLQLGDIILRAIVSDQHTASATLCIRHESGVCEATHFEAQASA